MQVGHHFHFLPVPENLGGPGPGTIIKEAHPASKKALPRCPAPPHSQTHRPCSGSRSPTPGLPWTQPSSQATLGCARDSQILWQLGTDEPSYKKTKKLSYLRPKAPHLSSASGDCFWNFTWLH